jgi:hypothetical protein
MVTQPSDKNFEKVFYRLEFEARQFGSTEAFP